MKQYANLLGMFSLVFLFFGGTVFLLSKELDLYVGINLALGVAGGIFFLSARISDLTSLLQGKAVKTFSFTFLVSLLLLGTLVFINLIVSKKPKQWDLTREKIFSLSDQTKKVLSKISKPVKGYYFQEGGIGGEAETILKLYSYEQKLFQYEVLDPQAYPDLVNQFQVRQNNTLILTYPDSPQNYQKVTKLTEEEITKAFLKLVQGTEVKIGFLTGHGELSVERSEDPGSAYVFKTLLEEQNYRVETLNLMELGKVPEDVMVLVALSPRSAYYPEELSIIGDFLRKGRGFLLLLDPRNPEPMEGFQKLLGITFGRNIIIDKTVRLFAGPTLGTQIIVSRFPAHTITKELEEPVVFQEACSLHFPSSVTVPRWEVLLRSSFESWAETDLERLIKKREVEKDPKDIPGPVTFGVVFTGFPNSPTPQEGEREPRGVVLCDSDFLNNSYIGQLGNKDFALNLIGYLAQEVHQITIRPKNREFSRLTLSTRQMANVFFFTVLIFPEILLLLGLFVWYRRRV